MARIDEKKYEDMISALHTFASNVYNASSEMQSLATVCASALGDEDPAVSQITSKINECQVKYSDACDTARSIANEMQEELDEQRQENDVWAED